MWVARVTHDWLHQWGHRVDLLLLLLLYPADTLGPDPEWSTAYNGEKTFLSRCCLEASHNSSGWLFFGKWMLELTNNWIDFCNCFSSWRQGKNATSRSQRIYPTLPILEERKLSLRENLSSAEESRTPGTTSPSLRREGDPNNFWRMSRIIFEECHWASRSTKAQWCKSRELRCRKSRAEQRVE